MPQKKDDKLIYIVFGIIAYFFTMLIFLHAAKHMENGAESIIVALIDALETSLSEPFFFLPLADGALKVMGIGTMFFILIAFYVAFEIEKDAKRLHKNQKGSSEWYSDFKGYNKEFTDPPGKVENDGPKNMIFTNNVFLTMDTRQTLRNNNVLVIGGSGSGKSRFFVKPNILQANCSYVITDPSGELLTSQGKFLKDKGYKIKVFNLVDMKHSNCYNPFNYIRDDLGVLMLVNCLIKNTTPAGASKGDPFWEKSETALLQALIFYLIKYRPKEEQNFTSVMKLLRAAEVDENNPNAKSPLDRLFDEVARTDPKSIALKQYMTFKMGAGKTLKSILISCSVRLTVFNMKEIENLTGTDDIDLRTLGDEKQALFVVIPAADDTYNFLVSMMYSQLFETLYYHAEIECPNGYYIKDSNKSVIKFIQTEEDADKYIKEHPGTSKSQGKKMLASHCRFLLDEFANIGQIPEFDKKLATMRKYEISCSIILQNLAQIKEMYDKKAEGLIGNCDSILFLGSSEYETCEYISKKLGKASVIIRNNSRNMSAKGGGSSLSYQNDARDLLTPDEVSRLSNDECILFIRGLQAFRTKKYDYPKHPNYKFTGDANDKNIYEYEKDFDNSRASFNNIMKRVVDKKIKEDEIKVKPIAKNSDVKDVKSTIKTNTSPVTQKIEDNIKSIELPSMACNEIPKYNIDKAKKNKNTTNNDSDKKTNTNSKKSSNSSGEAEKTNQEEWLF